MTITAANLDITPGDLFIDDDGHLVEIFYDSDCPSPRYDYNLGTFYTWVDGRYSPDGENNKAPRIEELAPKLGFDIDECNENPFIWLLRKMEESGYAVLPVSLYSHSGDCYRTGGPGQFPDSQFDAMYAGIIFASPDDMKEFYTLDKVDEGVLAEARKALENEVSAFDDWAAGRCFGYNVIDEYGEEIYSSGGFIGDDAVENGIVSDARIVEPSPYSSVDEYVEAMRAMRLARSWKSEIKHSDEVAFVTDGVRREMARKAQVIDGEGYSLEDELDWMMAMSIRAIPKSSPLYEKLEEWHGDHATLMAKARLSCEDEHYLYFAHGGGYAVFDEDLLGGDGTGRAEKAFETFLETGVKPTESTLFGARAARGNPDKTVRSGRGPKQ